METETKPKLTQADLDQFIGTSCYYRYLFGLKLTDGVKYLADNAGGGAYWLLDIIASYQTSKKVRGEGFQLWELKLVEKSKDPHINNQPAVVTMKSDSDRPNIVRQTIMHTDFPLESVKLYLIDGVILLPSEY